MADVNIKLHSREIRKLLKSEELAAVCDAEARRMTEATGVEYRPDVYPGRYRIRASASSAGGGYTTTAKLEKKRTKSEKNKHRGRTKPRKKKDSST